MDKKAKRQEKILSAVNDIFKEIKVASKLRLKKDEPDLSMDLLQVLHTDFGIDGMEILGEYGFSPVTNVDDVQYFIASLVIKEDIPKENMMTLLAAIGSLNFFIPSGSFAYDASESELVFKNAVPLVDSLTDEQFIGEINMIIVNALEFAERYTYLLTEVSNGNIDFEQFTDALEDEFVTEDNK